VNRFDNAADFYEILAHNTGRLDREGPFLLQCLNAAPGNRVVDVACGTGLHAQFLATHGAEVTACDLSAAMIDKARKLHNQPNVTYKVGDMCAVAGGPYDLALCLGNSLSLLEDDTQLMQTFRSIRAALAPGGLLVVQTLNYGKSVLLQARHRVEQRTADGLDIVAAKVFVPVGDVTLLSITFWARGPEGLKVVNEAAVLRHISSGEMEDAARQVGLEVIQICGDFAGRPYEPEESTDVIVVFKAP